MKPRALEMLDLFFEWAESEPGEENGIERDAGGTKWVSFAEGSKSWNRLDEARKCLRDEYEEKQRRRKKGFDR